MVMFISDLLSSPLPSGIVDMRLHYKCLLMRLVQLKLQVLRHTAAQAHRD